MAEPSTEVSPEPGIDLDPEEFFDEGFSSGMEIGSDDAREQLYDDLIDEGFDEEEVDELLYDPAPRRRRHRRHRRSKRYDPAPRRRRGRRRTRRSRRYDPAPNGYRSRARRYGRKAKGMLSKLKPIVMPGAAGLTFYSAYTERSKTLFTSGLITKDSVYDAIMYDLKNFDANAAIDRLQANASGIATPIVVGMIAKWGKAYIDPKLRGPIDVVGDALIGVGIGTGFKKLLDPPVQGQTQTQQRRMQAPLNTQVNRATAGRALVLPTEPCPGCSPSNSEPPQNTGVSWRV